MIKVLPSKCQDDEDLLIRFHVAARAAVGLFHLNIALIYDVDKDLEHGIHYLVREYVCGSDLQSMVEKKGPFDYRMAADLIAQAAGGLAYAHAAGILHLDVSPSQLVADHRGVLKILDFGLSVLTTGVTDYLAPEQVVGSGRLDGRADIYGLGHTFYFLLTGHRPFPKPTLPEVLMAHQTEERAPVGRFRVDVPQTLVEIIKRMTAEKPIHRYQTAKEVAMRLRSWLNE